MHILILGLKVAGVLIVVAVVALGGLAILLMTDDENPFQ